ncbi:MAG: site-specific DNA-methyltransferase [Selenomonadaceae bacterium]|nr:site-specific DNA-methyltransferase [Selenomonadaceae bacterium]
MSRLKNICLLYNCDCFSYLRTLPNKYVDLVIIDPPYEISRDTRFMTGKIKEDDTCKFRISMDFGEWDKNFAGLDYVIKECYRVLKKHGTIICFYDLWKITTLKLYLKNAGFHQIRFIEWIKTNPIPINSKLNYLTNAREIAVLGVKNGKPTFYSEYDNGIYNFGICQDKGRFHPTQKPVALLKELIEKHSEKNDLVLDCFAGSASTAVAAYQSNRNFIDCEISEEYYKKSIARLKDIGAIKNRQIIVM